MWAVKCMTRKGYLDPMSVEALAAMVTTQFSNELGARNVFLEGDAKNIVEAVKSQNSDESHRGHLFADIILILSSFLVWEMGYVCRDRNNVAHALATTTMRGNVNRVWLYDPQLVFVNFCMQIFLLCFDLIHFDRTLLKKKKKKKNLVLNTYG